MITLDESGDKRHKTIQERHIFRPKNVAKTVEMKKSTVGMYYF
jgi:hypothetical protein